MLHQSCKEEFSDWPNELLAIGTFGSLKDCGNLNQPTCRPDQSLTAEEVGQLHKELKHLFPEESTTPLSAKLGSKKDLEKFFDCLQNLVGDDHKVIENKESIFKRGSSLVRGRAQEESVQLENTNSAISKKSLSYLLKKILFCSAGFTPPPPLPLRDPVLPQSKFEKSRMEKILRAILHKKIYPQAASPRATTTRKRYLDNGCVIESDSEDETFETVRDNGSKWDKSDSDCATTKQFGIHTEVPLSAFEPNTALVKPTLVADSTSPCGATIYGTMPTTTFMLTRVNFVKRQTTTWLDRLELRVIELEKSSLAAEITKFKEELANAHADIENGKAKVGEDEETNNEGLGFESTVRNLRRATGCTSMIQHRAIPCLVMPARRCRSLHKCACAMSSSIMLGACSF
ncbi:hypothetical protein HAX54_008847 [Datura stramonium]|uniref:Uncharacterized protein n=1 Tax=Datura stramonium TaxID=4076 RepID=A0ABS8RVP6_DATST|nr:hypothetical protein [Datura stramonium]